MTSTWFLMKRTRHLRYRQKSETATAWRIPLSSTCWPIWGTPLFFEYWITKPRSGIQLVSPGPCVDPNVAQSPLVGRIGNPSVTDQCETGKVNGGWSSLSVMSRSGVAINVSLNAGRIAHPSYILCNHGVKPGFHGQRDHGHRSSGNRGRRDGRSIARDRTPGNAGSSPGDHGYGRDFP